MDHTVCLSVRLSGTGPKVTRKKSRTRKKLITMEPFDLQPLDFAEGWSQIMSKRTVNCKVIGQRSRSPSQKLLILD